MTGITLYKRRKDGKIELWEAWPLLDGVEIRHGVLGGKTITTIRKVAGKNIGRANETSPVEQAVKETEALYDKKIRLGYVVNINKIDDIAVKPMLAQRLKSVSDIQYPVYVQPKLNGVRCIVNKNDLVLRSRGNKTYNIPALQEQLKEWFELYKHYNWLDGELYVHGMSFQQIIRRVKNGKPVQYHIFDRFSSDATDIPFKERKLSVFYTHRDIIPVQTFCIETHREFNYYYQRFISVGYEGIIIRDPNGVYEHYRSKYLLKHKPMLKSEYTITGYDRAKGAHEGAIIFICKTESGKVFRVAPKATIAARRGMLSKGSEYIGKKLTVKYQELSEDGIPIFPVGLMK